MTYECIHYDLYSMKLVQAASFNYDMLYKVARAISDEVRAKVKAGVHNEGRKGKGKECKVPKQTSLATSRY